MKDNLTLIIENILENISTNKKYKGFVLEESLITYNYLKKLGFSKTVWWKNILKLLFGLINWIDFLSKPKVVYNIKTECAPIIIAINFAIDDERHSKILMDFINNYPKKNDLIILTNKKCISEYCYRKDFAYVFFKTSPFNICLSDLFSGYSINESFIFKEYREYIDFLCGFYNRINPKLLITTQDFLLPDFYYARVAKKFKIKTITHQHGEIPDTEKSLYSILFSDLFLCWGANSKQKLSRSIPESKIEIAGTTKFNHSIISEKDIKEYIILITPTVFPIIKFRAILLNLLFEIKEFNNVIIKPHPSQNIIEVKNLVKEICKELKILSPILVIKDNINSLLKNASVMINIKSGVYLEGLVSNTSMIELNIDGAGGSLRKIEESFIEIKDVCQEIKRRMNDNTYNEYILRRQDELLEDNIFTKNLDLEFKIVNRVLTQSLLENN